MRAREQLEYLSAGAVAYQVERQTAARHEGLTVGRLRALVLLAALLRGGAVVRGADLWKSGLLDRKWAKAYLRALRKDERWARLVGATHTGYYELTPAGRAVVEEYARAVRRAAAQLLAFESVHPYNRLTPKK